MENGEGYDIVMTLYERNVVCYESKLLRFWFLEFTVLLMIYFIRVYVLIHFACL